MALAPVHPVALEGRIEHYPRFIQSGGGLQLSCAHNKWIVTVTTNVLHGVKYLGFVVKCNEHFLSNLWGSRATVTCSLLNKDPLKTFSLEQTKRFSQDQKEMLFPQFKMTSEVTFPESGFMIEEKKIRIGVEIRVHENFGNALANRQSFDEPKENLTDVVLIVEDTKLHVGKQVLANQSKVFYNMFYVDEETKSKAEIVITGVKSSEFIDLLNMINPSDLKVSDRNYEHLLKLAHKYQVRPLIGLIEIFLKNNLKIHAIDKLVLAETYTLATVQDHTIKRFKSTHQIDKILKHKHFNKLGYSPNLMLKKFVELMQEEDRAIKQRKK